MANKVWTLFEIEFKRIQKIYFSVLGCLFFANVGIFSFFMYLNILEAESTLGYKIGISVFKEKVGREVLRSADLTQIYICYLLHF